MGKIKAQNPSVGAPIEFVHKGEKHTYETYELSKERLDSMQVIPNDQHLPSGMIYKIDGKILRHSNVFLQMAALMHFKREIEDFLAETDVPNSGPLTELMSEQAEG